MAFATKFKTTIEDWNGDTITAEIQEDGFAGTVQEFTPVGGNPITIEHQCNVNEKESHIIPSKARISIYVNYDWDLVELLYAKDRTYKVIIKNGSTPLFFGWVIAAVNGEDYETGRYKVNVDAIDGIADLKSIPYLNSGALYNEYQTPVEIIDNVIAEIGLGTYAFYENAEIYSSAMTTPSATVSPLNQCYIHTDSYGRNTDDVLSCWDVLEAVMQFFHCRFFQSSPLSGTNNSWFISSIRNLGSTKTYRRWSSGIYTSNISYNPLLTLASAPTEPHHVGGAARISIQQGFKEVNVTTARQPEPSLLLGANFADEDFPTSSTLTNWGSISNSKLIATWADSTITKETIGEDTMLALDDYQRQHGGSLTPDTVSDNGGGLVRITKTSHNLVANDWVILEQDTGTARSYRGLWRVQAGPTANTFDLTATYDSNYTSTRWRTINAIEGVEYDTSLSFFDARIPEDATGQFIKFNADYYIEERTPGDTWSFVMAVLVAHVSSTDKKVLGYDGRWRDYVGAATENDIKPILDIIEESYNDRQPKPITGSIEVIGELSSSNNFYSLGETCKFYLGLYGLESSVAGTQLKWKNVSVSMIYGADEVETSTIDTDFVESKDVTFFHANGDSGLNEEFRFLAPVADDASPRNFTANWDDNVNTDTPENLFKSQLVSIYGDNSQIWSGTIKGDVDITNAIKDTLNFDRVFQIQRINRNLVNNFNDIAMIEIDPAGEPTFSLSVSTPSNAEIPKGQDDTTIKKVTITNTGNALVSAVCAFSGGDTSHFEFVGNTTFEIPVGKSAVLQFRAVTGDAIGAYASNITVNETRAYRTMTQKTIEIGHYNDNQTRLINGNVTNSEISTALNGATVSINRTGGTANPTSKTITGIFGQNILWTVQGTGGSGSATMQLKNGVTVLATDNLTAGGSFSGSITPDLHAYIVAGNWDGEDLNYELL